MGFKPISEMNKNSLKWAAVAILLLAVLAFVMPVFIAASAKGLYFIVGGLLVLYFIYLAFKKAESPFFFLNAEQRKAAPKLSNFMKFSLALLAVACIGIIGGFTSMRIGNALKKDGVLTTAVISGGEHRTTKSLKRGTENTYTLEFYYTTAKGEIIESSESVSAAEYAKVAVGVPVKVIYLPNHPNVMKLLLTEESQAEYKK